jgi:hypothetical protein
VEFTNALYVRPNFPAFLQDGVGWDTNNTLVCLLCVDVVIHTAVLHVCVYVFVQFFDGHYLRAMKLRVFLVLVTPLQAYGAQRVLGRLRLADSVTSALEGGRLSAIRTGRLYPREYPGTHFKRLSRPRAHGMKPT